MRLCSLIFNVERKGEEDGNGDKKIFIYFYMTRDDAMTNWEENE